MGPTVELPAGMYSDDTQLRLSVARCIRATGQFDIETFSKVELPVFRSYALGAGRGTKSAAQHLTKRNVRWYSNFFEDRGSRYVNGGGNGAAMRIQPHVWAASDLRDLPLWMRDVARDTVSTHGHPRALVGAAFHALTLAETLRVGLPEPKMWKELALDVRVLHDIFERDEILASRWIPLWETQSEMDWHATLDSTVEELSEMLSAASAVGGASGGGREDELRGLLGHIGGLDESTRGSGVIAAVASTWIAWAYRSDPEKGLCSMSNILGADTDTIASMAGALVGVFSGPIRGPLVDGQLHVDEALRLVMISEGSAVHDFPHPDPIGWKPPSRALDVTLAHDGRPFVVGLGSAVEMSAALAGGRADSELWQWLELDFGQTILAKRRPAPEQAKAWALPVARDSRRSVIIPTQLALMDSGAEPEHEERAAMPARVEDGVQLAADSGFDPEIVGRLVLHFTRQQYGSERAAVFCSLLATRLAQEG